MKTRYPLPIDRRPTPALEARMQLLRVAGGITALGLVLILALILATRSPHP